MYSLKVVGFKTIGIIRCWANPKSSKPFTTVSLCEVPIKVTHLCSFAEFTSSIIKLFYSSVGVATENILFILGVFCGNGLYYELELNIVQEC